VFRTLLYVSLLITLPLEGANDGPQIDRKALSELNKIADYGEATKAMSDRLPGVAIVYFRALLRTPGLSDDARAATNHMLAEAIIRFSIELGGDQKLAAEALEILASKAQTMFPSTALWRAEALVSLGQYSEAEKVLRSIPKNHPLSSESQIARARILIALNKRDQALIILNALSKKNNSTTSNTAALLAAEIHINTGKNDLALEALNRVGTDNPTSKKLKEYLAARLALDDNKTTEAVNRFQSLITAPDEHHSKRIYHACFLGLSDAQAANNDTDGAILTLQQFIDDYQDSHLLQAAFERLISHLPIAISTDDPSMQKLRLWAGEKPLTSESAILGSGDGVTSIQLSEATPMANHELTALALFYRAKLLTRTQSEQNLLEATAILTRLRNIYSQSSQPPSELYLELFSASLLETAYIQLQQKELDLATHSLTVMEEITFSPQLKNQSSILRGEILAGKNDYEGAMRAFKGALFSTSEIIAKTASNNAGIMALKASNLLAFQKIINSTQDSKIKTSLALERALWMCTESNIQGRNDLDAFIMANSGYSRENEARLALAAACVNISPPDIQLAKAQLEIITPKMKTAAEQAKITRIRIRAESLLQEWQSAAQAAESFLLKFKDSKDAASIEFKCAESYYHNEDYNKARRIFQGFEKKYPNNALIPYAQFYEAMSARLGGTAQSREECIAMFKKIIDTNHKLAAEARVQQSRLLIDLQRYTEAEATLNPMLESNKISLQQKLGAGVLMADCLQRQSLGEINKTNQAITIYNDLLKSENLSLAWIHRLHYLRGQAYESMKNNADAFKSYYNVIIDDHRSDNLNTKKEEWFWFYRCGFKALAMLEANGNWEAAVRVAKRVASFNGPRKQEADRRAKDLARKHMIWSDNEPQQQPK